MARFGARQFECMIQELERGDREYRALFEIIDTLYKNKPDEQMTYAENEVLQKIRLKAWKYIVADLGETLKDETIPLEERMGRFGSWLRITKACAEADVYREMHPEKKKKKKNKDGEEEEEREYRPSRHPNGMPKEPHVPFDDPFLDSRDAMFDPEAFPELARLRGAFNFVIAERSSIYIKLAWLGTHLFMVFGDREKIGSTRHVVERFSNLPLKEYYKAVLNAADRVPWIVLSDSQKKLLEGQLNQTSPKADVRDGKVKTYAETSLATFYMDKGGENLAADGRASISDWVNKFNKKINNKQNDPTKGESE